MIIVSWNSQGLGNPRAVHALSEIIKSRQPDILFLCEMLVHLNKIKVIKTLGIGWVAVVV